MKAITVALLLALCGLATATTVFKRQDIPANCQPTSADFINAVSGCTAFAENPTPQGLCSDACFGAACTYFRNNNMDSCRSALATTCTNAEQKVPSACGALALVTFKGVIVAVLLLAAFLIF